MSFQIVYELGDALYINVTNACTNRCEFCVRNNIDGIQKGLDLWLDREPSAKEIVEELSKSGLRKYEEIVFCGYGEPLMRPDVVFEVCRCLREIYGGTIRINTNGQANLYHHADITPLMKGLVDAVSISLNASNKEDYDRTCASDFGQEAFSGILEFAEKCKQVVPKVIFTVVDVMDKQEIERCRNIADQLGVDFRIRRMIT